MSPRRFVAVFLAVTLLALAAVAAFNLVMDPHGNFDVGLVEPHDPSTQISKARAARRIDGPPDLLILGSSRAWTTDSEHFRARYGWTCFNGAVEEGRVADALAMYRYFREEVGVPARVLIGLDHEWLQPLFHDSHTLYPSPLWPYAHSTTADHLTFDDYARPFFELISLQQSVDGLRIIKREITGVQPNTMEVVDADGVTRLPIIDQEIEAGQYDLQKYVTRDTELVAKVNEWRGDLSLARERDLETLFDLITADGAALYVYLPPYHPTALKAACQNADFCAAYASTRAYLAELQTRYGFTFRDFTDINTFGGNPSEFYDGVHPRFYNMNIMIDLMFNGENPSVAETTPADCDHYDDGLPALAKDE